MVKSPAVLLKIGGSLCQPYLLMPLASEIRSLTEDYPLLILPGGGIFTERVREVDRKFSLEATTSHWMAILGMEQYGCLLAEVLKAKTITRVSDLQKWQGEKAAVFLPYRYLCKRDNIPHSWNATSDTIAAALAAVLGVKMLVLIKAVDGISTADEKAILPIARQKELKDSCFVDRCFYDMLPAGLETWVINGKEPQRLVKLLRSGIAAGTRIVK